MVEKVNENERLFMEVHKMRKSGKVK